MRSIDAAVPTPERIARDRCIDRGCECDEASEAGESCRQYHGSNYGEYCDPCLMSMLLTALETAHKAAEDEERAHERTVDERDAAQDAADKLAYAIAPVEAIGEHSNLNNPWQNALDELETIKERAEAWGLLNQARQLDQETVARAKDRADAAERQVETLQAEVARLRELTTWQPISKLGRPKRGTRVLTPDGIAYWSEETWLPGRWNLEGDDEAFAFSGPTVYMPLPAAPTAAREET